MADAKNPYTIYNRLFATVPQTTKKVGIDAKKENSRRSGN
jgi:hypothetical protein